MGQINTPTNNQSGFVMFAKNIIVILFFHIIIILKATQPLAKYSYLNNINLLSNAVQNIF